MSDLGKVLIAIGVLFLIVGGLVILFPRIGLSFGHLPGDFRWQSGQFTCLVPLGTSILVSVLLTLGLRLLGRFLNR